MSLSAISSLTFRIGRWYLAKCFLIYTYIDLLVEMFGDGTAPIPYAPQEMALGSRILYYCWSQRTWEFARGFISGIFVDYLHSALIAWDLAPLKPGWRPFLGNVALVVSSSCIFTRFENRGQVAEAHFNSSSPNAEDK